MAMPERKIEMRPLVDIRPYERNAKSHPKSQVEQIAASIKAFGFNQPIVVDNDGVIIVGHGRFFAAEHLGLEEAPVITVALTKDEAAAYRLADNKMNESQWDMELVRQDLTALPPALLELTGFGAKELRQAISQTKEVNFTAIAEGLHECPKCGFRFEKGKKK